MAKTGRGKRPTWVSAILAVVALIYVAIDYFNPSEAGNVSGHESAGPATGIVQMHVIDVGQGDAILIQTENHNVLIDAGENDYGYKVTDYLKKQGVDELSLVIGTHAHSDHIGGLDTVLENISADILIMGDYDYDTKTYWDVVNAAEEQGVKHIRLNEIRTYKFDDVLFDVYMPPEGYVDDINDCSIWVMVSHGENKYLMYGDGGYRIEEDMLEYGVDLDADVLKVTHHGSSDGTSDQLLKAVSPDYAVISVGHDNSYGHPHHETRNKLKKVETYRTDKVGNVIFTGDGKDITVTTGE